MNVSIADESYWTETSIDRRAERLIPLALKLWPSVILPQLS